MPQHFEDKIPNQGMNRDDEARLVATNDSRYFLNLRAGSSDDDNVGAVENVKGNTLVQAVMPPGRSKVIGSHGDQPSGSNYFFLWNSTGQHTIFRYISKTREIRILVQDELLSFNEFDLINDIKVVEELLYWRDFENSPRKINIEKSDNDNKATRQIWNWYLGDEYMKGQTSLDLYFTQRTNRYDGIGINVPFTLSYTLLDPLTTSKTDIAKDLTNQINNVASMATPIIKASSCGEFVSIETITDDYITISATQNLIPTAQVVPQNHYFDYSERTIDIIKHPIHCDIDAIIKTDITKNRNYISKKVFQFASRLIYDDNEKSTVNPHSVSIYNKFQCPQFSTHDLNNYIEIDLSVIPEINNSVELQTIKRIELYFREGELGLWRSMTVLDQFEFVDVSNQHFNFYNDENYKTVDKLDFVRLFDLVPQRTKNLEIAKNRLFMANNLEGYENTCVDAELTVTYDDVEARILPPTYTVSGRIDIRGAFNGSAIQNFNPNGAIKDHQPIWRDVTGSGDDGDPTDSPIVFGGLGDFPGFLPDPKLENIATKTGQVLPLGGFTVYLAGTNYYGISKQRPKNYTGKSDVSQDDNGVFQGSGGDYVGSVRSYVTEEGDFGECFSTFEIANIPDGWYTLRVAGHGTTQGELDSGNLNWQRTSTNVFGFENHNISEPTGNQFGIYNYAEQVRGIHEILVHVQGGDIGGITFNIMDLSHTFTLFGDYERGSSHIITGYLAANDIQASSIDYNVALNDTRMSSSMIRFNIGAASIKILESFTGIPVAAKDITDWAEDYWTDSGDFDLDSDGIARFRTDQTITDHNGYYFFGSIQAETTFPVMLDNLSIKQVSALNNPSSIYGYTNYSNGNGSARLSEVEPGEFVELATIASGDINHNRVKVVGNVFDQDNLAIPGVAIVSNRCTVSKSDANGDFEFWHFGIRKVAGIYQTVVFPTNAGGSCSAIYQDSQIYDFNFDYPSEYSAFATVPNKITNNIPITVQVPSPLFLGDSSSMVTLNAFKRGGDWQFGIVYYDRGMRSSAVNTEERLNLHIPFYSEKAEDGLIKNGVPIINWEVKSRPPAWATHWQWVRTKNSKIAQYLQWAADEVSYQDSNGNPSTYQSGTRVLLVIANLDVYGRQNPGTDFQWSPDDSSRVRFMKNHDGTRYTDYVDVPLLAFDSGNTIVIEKTFELGEFQEGVLFEIYNELLDVEEDIYYEFGECFEVKEDNNKIKYHGGLITANDQNPLLPSSSPATGTFRTGDAYYRLRGIPNAGANSSAYIDDDGISDFYQSELESIGRPNGEDSDAAQLWKPTQIRHSGKYIPDSKINNLSQFKSDDFQPLPIEYGAIHKLILASNILMSIHVIRWVSNYIEEAVVRKQSGTDEIIASKDVFGAFRAAKQITGTINQESVEEYRGTIWAWDENKGLVNRWGADGLTPISAYKMENYFKDKAEDIKNNKGEDRTLKSLVLGVYDRRFDEYILSFGEIANRALQTDPGDNGLPTYRIGLDVNNSQLIEVASNDTLYSMKGSKEEGSILIIDEDTSPEAKSIQIDNRQDSLGSLSVKVRQPDNSLIEVTKLAPGQGIEDFNVSDRTFGIKNNSSDFTPATTDTAEGLILVPGETVSFNERINKWITFYSYRPEMFGVINLELLSFKAGRLWVHNDNALRNNFYGVQYTSQIEAIFNQPPGQVKVFQAIGIESYHAWDVKSAKTPNGMETIVVAGRFRRKEDGFYAPMMRDLNDPRYIGNPNEAVVNGQQLRDRTVTVLMENHETVEVVLFAVSMESTLSTRHQK